MFPGEPLELSRISYFIWSDILNVYSYLWRGNSLEYLLILEIVWVFMIYRDLFYKDSFSFLLHLWRYLSLEILWMSSLISGNSLEYFLIFGDCLGISRRILTPLIVLPVHLPFCSLGCCFSIK